jgi:Tfp pilus assembly protein PilX
MVALTIGLGVVLAAGRLLGMANAAYAAQTERGHRRCRPLRARADRPRGAPGRGGRSAPLLACRGARRRAAGAAGGARRALARRHDAGIDDAATRRGVNGSDVLAVRFPGAGAGAGWRRQRGRLRRLRRRRGRGGLEHLLCGKNERRSRAALQVPRRRQLERGCGGHAASTASRCCTASIPTRRATASQPLRERRCDGALDAALAGLAAQDELNRQTHGGSAWSACASRCCCTARPTRHDAANRRVPAVRRRPCSQCGRRPDPRARCCARRLPDGAAAARAPAVLDDGGAAGGGLVRRRASLSAGRGPGLRAGADAGHDAGRRLDLPHRVRRHRISRAEANAALPAKPPKRPCATPSATSPAPMPVRATLFTGAGCGRFVDGCGRGGNSRGPVPARPRRRPGSAWTWPRPAIRRSSLTVITPARPWHGPGLLTARLPAYLIEKIAPPGATEAMGGFYRITAIGFGSRATTRVVLQSVYRLPKPAPPAGIPRRA